MPPKKKAAKSKSEQPVATASATGKKTDEPGPAKQEDSHVKNAAVSVDDKNQDKSHKQSEPDSKVAAKEQETATKDQPTKPSKKRQRPDDEDTNQPSKSARRSKRSKTQPTHLQLLTYLLSAAATSLILPDDEKKAEASFRAEHDENLVTYSNSVLTPFQELLCALILSRPISHRLGLRSIRTIFNPPYDFTTPQKIQSAGTEKRHQALWDAKTQHKGKTAEQIGAVAELVMEKYTSSSDDDDSEGAQLKQVLKKSAGDVDAALESLKEDVKGLGNTGLDIFLRRVQWLEGWSAAYPFVDGRTRIALKAVGLPDDAEDLREVIEEAWEQLPTEDLAGSDQATKKRRAFVIVLERVIGADLESKVEELIEAASSS